VTPKIIIRNFILVYYLVVYKYYAIIMFILLKDKI